MHGDENGHVDSSDMVEEWSLSSSSTSPLSADLTVTAPYEGPNQPWAPSILYSENASRPAGPDRGHLSTPHNQRYETGSFNPEQSDQSSRRFSEASDQGNRDPSHLTELISPPRSAITLQRYRHLSLMSQPPGSPDIPLEANENDERHHRQGGDWSQTVPVLPPRLQQGFKGPLIDMKALSYVGTIDHNLLCPICYCPFDSPRMLPCEHYFCRACIAQSLNSQDEASQSCPACRKSVSRADVSKAPRIIRHIVDDLKVQCPHSSEGCDAEMPRSSTQDHLDRYCAFAEVRCPDSGCSLPVPRRNADLRRCLHQVMFCNNCHTKLIELDVEAHNQKYCSNRMTSCSDCKKMVRSSELEAHIDTCPDSIWPCPASQYGCEFVGIRSALDLHTHICALAKLVPFLKKQTEMLDSHEAALKHLQHKSSILETSFHAIQEALTPNINLVDPPTSVTPTIADGPFDSTAHHLLCLHESLREEVSRVAATVSELDAKTSMTFVNESLRLKEDMSHTNSAINGMRLQLQWLVSARLQNQQRMAMMRTQRGSNDDESPGPSAGPGQPGRRMHDVSRQETKL